MDWKQVSCSRSSRCPRWYRPGLLLIGDAAHVMSLVGGIRMNYAIQDAVVAANVLAEPLTKSQSRLEDLDRHLAAAQPQREWMVRFAQAA